MTITVQMLNAIPFNSLNRNDNGAPKTYKLGGVDRAQLSSQSLKRSARLAFERDLLTTLGSTRSDEAALAVMDRVRRIAPDLLEVQKDWDKLLVKINETLIKLSKSKEEKPAADSKADGEKTSKGLKYDKSGRVELKRISLFLSNEELEIVAQAFVTQLLESQGAADGVDTLSIAVRDIVKKRTGSLSVAAFGRMFAAEPELSTEAAVSVSDACCVHHSLIVSDYFITGSDPVPGSRPSGAAFLSSSAHTSGVFHRSFSIDPAQLWRSWSGCDRDDARDQVQRLVRELVFGLPTGKQNSTAPFTPPLVVLAENQRCRLSYQFETPVEPHENGGYSQNAVSELAKQAHQLRQFDPLMVSESMVAGVADGLEQFPAEQMNVSQLVEQVADLVMQGIDAARKEAELTAL